MNDLIEALNILNKYINPAEKFPTWCGHDVFGVCVHPSVVSEEDIEKLNQLDFIIDDDCFISYRFGSC
jgi:hypothetical protein